MNPEAILFDLDGTLVDSAPSLHSALLKIAPQAGFAPPTGDQVRRWIGQGTRALVKEASGAMASESEVDRNRALFEQAYAGTLTETVLYSGVAAGLEKLQVAGFALACITNKPRQFVEPILEGLEISERFGVVVCGDDVARKKPHPEALITACERLGVAVENALMVGDSENDLIPARKMGMPRVAVTYGYHQGVDLRQYEPRLLASEFGQAVDCVIDGNR